MGSYGWGNAKLCTLDYGAGGYRSTIIYLPTREISSADEMAPDLVNKTLRALLHLSRFVIRYPQELAVSPEVFTAFHAPTRNGTIEAIISVQSVQDKLYFLLFGAMNAKLAQRVPARSDLVVVRAANGWIGVGWKASILRSAPVAWLLTSPWVRAYGQLMQGVAYRSATWAHPVRDCKAWFGSGHVWRRLCARGGNFELHIDGIEVGDLIVDSYLRLRPAPKFEVQDPFTRYLIWQAMRDVAQAQKYFGRVRPRWYLSSYSTYLEHGIPVRVALAQGATVYTFGNLTRFGKMLSQTDYFHTADCSRYREDFNVLDNKGELLEQAAKQLESRLSGGIDAATSYMRQSAYGQPGTQLPVGLEGAVVVFLHDFYDSPHIYPDLIFQDFWQWICFTIDTLQQQQIPFFLKPHPNQIALSDEATGLLRSRYPDLRWLPTNASNVDLVNAGIACGVTVYGTVAHELAYLGVPSIACARHPHYTFDFCRTAKTVNEYAAMLSSFDSMPLPMEEMRHQALAFYVMHNLYGTVDELELRNAFVDFYKICNQDDGVTEQDVLRSFHRMTDSPGFDRFIADMIDNNFAPNRTRVDAATGYVRHPSSSFN